MQRAPRIALALALGLAGALIAAELALRAAAAVVSIAGLNERAESARDGRPIVLFVGDSNVYGLHVASGETLPAQAEAVARVRCPPGFSAFNGGRSGAPSWVAREELEANLARLKPVAVVIRVGVNNSVAIPPDRATWLDGLRLVKLLRIALRNRDVNAQKGSPTGEKVGEDLLAFRANVRDGEDRPFVVKQAKGGLDFATAVEPILRRDLAAMAEAAGRAGAKTFFVSYSNDFFAFDDPNRAMREAAAATGSSFVDLRPVGKGALAMRQRGELYFSDYHATPLLYGVEARALVRALLESGVLRGAAPEDPLEWLASRSVEATPTLAREEDAGGALVISVRGAPRLGGRLVLGNPGNFVTPWGQSVPLADDELSRASRGAAELVFETDASGLARVTVPPAIRAKLPPRARVVALVTLGSPRDGTTRFLTTAPLDL